MGEIKQKEKDVPFILGESSKDYYRKAVFNIWMKKFGDVESWDLYSRYFTELPTNYTIISNRLYEITDLIKSTIVSKEDMEKSTNKIITQQKKEISDLKILINDLMSELKKRSIANIFIWISMIGLISSLSFLILSIFNGVLMFSYIHFILLSFMFSFILLMAYISRKSVNG